MIADGPTVDNGIGSEEKLTVASDTGPLVVVPWWLINSAVSSDALRLWLYLARWADRDDEVTMDDLCGALGTNRQKINRLIAELEQVGSLAGDDDAGYVLSYSRMP